MWRVVFISFYAACHSGGFIQRFAYVYHCVAAYAAVTAYNNKSLQYISTRLNNHIASRKRIESEADTALPISNVVIPAVLASSLARW